VPRPRRPAHGVDRLTTLRTERVVRGAMPAPLAFPDVTLGAADFLG
jgi:hypothetical protein